MLGRRRSKQALLTKTPLKTDAAAIARSAESGIISSRATEGRPTVL